MSRESYPPYTDSEIQLITLKKGEELALNPICHISFLDSDKDRDILLTDLLKLSRFLGRISGNSRLRLQSNLDRIQTFIIRNL